MKTDLLVTQLLHEWRSGNQGALEKLMPKVYDTLRQLAAGYMRKEAEGHTLQATVVVNEAYLRLADAEVSFVDRSHFLALAARAMRHILVDYAKSKKAQKRGGEATRVTLYETRLGAAHNDFDLLELEQVLSRLAEIDERKARVVELHFFGGLTYDEMAEVLGVSAATIDRELRFAKAWLLRSLKVEST